MHKSFLCGIPSELSAKSYANMKITFYDLHKKSPFLCKYENH